MVLMVISAQAARMVLVPVGDITSESKWSWWLAGEPLRSAGLSCAVTDPLYAATVAAESAWLRDRLLVR
jgi:hypothetical protein